MAPIPEELKESIVEALCIVCTPQHSPTCDTSRQECHKKCMEDESPSLYLRSLAALCRTSKQMQAIATRHLYERPTCVKWWKLLRTLIESPHLALYVKELVDTRWQRVWSRATGTMPEAVVNLYDDMSRHYHDAIRYDGRAPLERRFGYVTRDIRVVGIQSLTLRLEMFLMHCPNLALLDAHLEVDSCNFYLNFEVLRWMAHSNFSFCRPGSLPKLETVFLRRLRWDYDTFDWRSELDFDRIGHLPVVAPNMRRLECFYFGGYLVFDAAVRPPFPRLETLRLWDCLFDAPEMMTIALSCATIEAFGFQATRLFSDSPDLQVSPAFLQNCLSYQCRNLRELWVDYGHDGVLERDELYEYLDSTMVNLQRLRRLENLSVDTRVLVPHWAVGRTGWLARNYESDGDDELDDEAMLEQPGRPHAPTVLTLRNLLGSLLPRSIRSLRIDQSPFGPRMTSLYEALAELAQAARTGDLFPRLRTVRISGLDDGDFAFLRVLFVDAGVELRRVEYERFDRGETITPGVIYESE